MSFTQNEDVKIDFSEPQNFLYNTFSFSIGKTFMVVNPSPKVVFVMPKSEGEGAPY